MLRAHVCSLGLVLALTGFLAAKDAPTQVINWPQTGSPVVRVTLGKFKELSSVAGQHNYVIDTTAENLWSKKISHLGFSLYLYDKNKVRIGDGWITLDNVSPGQAVKFQTTVHALGTPVSVELAPNSVPAELQPLAPPKKISMTVNSVPQGARLLVDGAEAGTTPKLVQLAVGKHSLDFSKEGFNAGKFPLEIGPDDVSGGSVSYELGTSAHDTFELRDGTVLTGDLVSVSGMEIRVRVAGVIQTLDRNKVKRILLTERDPVSP
ncbi:MAG: PEGA domain-containing protein [Acidobacteriales bacterium]|nr:PEGA domain-containing protein [Terriglobales bacterium]